MYRSLPAKAERSDSSVITILYRDHAKALRTVQRVILSRLLSEHHNSRGRVQKSSSTCAAAPQSS